MYIEFSGTTALQHEGTHVVDFENRGPSFTLWRADSPGINDAGVSAPTLRGTDTSVDTFIHRSFVSWLCHERATAGLLHGSEGYCVTISSRSGYWVRTSMQVSCLKSKPNMESQKCPIPARTKNILFLEKQEQVNLCFWGKNNNQKYPREPPGGWQRANILRLRTLIKAQILKIVQRTEVRGTASCQRYHTHWTDTEMSVPLFWESGPKKKPNLRVHSYYKVR